VPAKKTLQSAIFMPQMFQRGIHEQQALGSKTNKTQLLLLSLCWLLLVSSTAKPVRIGEWIDIKNNGRDMFLAVDLSGSMQEQDMPLRGQRVDRLTMVKAVLKEFIQRRQGDRLGLIVFGTNAYIQAPLTFDLNTVETLLNEAEIGFAGNDTAIGNAIGLGIKRLANNPNDSRVLILLTDGENTAGQVDPIQAARLAQQEHVVIYTVGIGSNERQGSVLGFGGYNPSRGLDEKTLASIAEISGGKFFRASDADELNAIYQHIDALEAIEQDAEKLRPKEDLFYWPLSIFLFCFLLHLLLQLGFNKQNRGENT
jgi:Ca-activated chloride channel family protein